MVVGIQTHIFEVIVFSSGPNAFLGICCLGVASDLVSQKIRNELIHPRIGE